jgi:peptidoglycan/xylan/chitin deacetylase (PgdA/CDA1 family)
MNIITKIRKHFLVRKKFELLSAFLAISFLFFHGYRNHEDFIDDEKLQIEKDISVARPTSISSKEVEVKNSTIGTTTVPILVYHKINKPDFLPRVSKRKAVNRFDVLPGVFEGQIKLMLDNGYTFLTMQDLIMRKKTHTLPNKPAAITFDDGWRSQYDNALPVLIKYHIPATFYIYTGVIGSPAYMTWDDLQMLVAIHMEIGDHTKTHPRLTKIDPRNIHEELVQSKHVLEKHLHVPVTDFAFPYGNYNATIIEYVKNAGYISARTSNPGTYNDFKNLYELNVVYAPTDVKTFGKLVHIKM